jgi:hypothetical protein
MSLKEFIKAREDQSRRMLDAWMSLTLMKITTSSRAKVLSS